MTIPGSMAARAGPAPMPNWRGSVRIIRAQPRKLVGLCVLAWLGSDYPDSATQVGESHPELGGDAGDIGRDDRDALADCDRVGVGELLGGGGIAVGGGRSGLRHAHDGFARLVAERD